LRELRRKVRTLLTDDKIPENDKTPEKIAKAIREDPLVKELLQFSRKRKSWTFDNAQVAASVLLPWLPGKPAKPLLRELFQVKTIWRSLNRYRTTFPAIAEAVEWARRGGTRLSYLAKESTRSGTKTFSESGSEWRNLARLMPADGFDPWAPLYGYRRPSLSDSPLRWRVSELQPALRSMVEKDTRLEMILRSRETRWDEEKGSRLRETLLLVIQGWLPVTAMRHMDLDMPKTTFLSLARNPKLCGMMLDKQGEVWNMKLDQSILSGVEFVRLLARIPPRGRKLLFGLVWENGVRVAEPEDEEVWMVDICYSMHVENKLGYSRISELTKLGRDQVRKMFELPEYKAIVGEERFAEAGNVNTLHDRIEHGKEVRKSIVDAISRLRERHRKAGPEQIADQIGMKPDAVGAHLRILLRAGSVVKLPRRLGYDLPSSLEENALPKAEHPLMAPEVPA
jgi:DNA-binding transcriptional ArsR family regulator